MSNAEIAQSFLRIALLLDLRGGENPFRVRAYERAALTIESLSKDLRELYDEGGVKKLKELSGIGDDLALKIEEMLRTGKLVYMEKLEKQLPQGLIDIMGIEGMGPKKTKLVWQKFKVKSIEDLAKLARSGKLEKLKGWGTKSVENILKGIEQRKRMSGRVSVGLALPIAEEIVEALRASGLCKEVEIAGSLRRRRETIGDIDILVTSGTPEKVMDVFCSLPHVRTITAKGRTKSTVFLKAGFDADLRVVDPDVFGAALYYFTGSKAHNVHVRRIAIEKGITVSEYGVYKGTAEKKGKLLAARTEKDVFQAVGLPYIPPELREDRGEIEAAKRGALPTLIEDGDLKGDLHLHSHFSDGSASIEDMAKAAKDAGLEYIAITDHASPMGMVKGIKKETIKDYLDRVRAARKKISGMHILAGAEVDILQDGRLYLGDDILKELDWVVASVHQYFKQPREETTRRIIAALGNPFVDVLGHPTTRIIGQREGIDLDMESVLMEVKKRKVAMEVSASVERLDLNDIHSKRAKELGVLLCINSDAHAVSGFDFRFGIAQARRGWLERSDVLNTRTWAQFEKLLKRRR